MAKFRKKPVVIEAVQYGGPWLETWPMWLKEAWLKDAGECGSLHRNENGELQIFTLEGIHRVSLDDWIIRGVQGELYPCKPDIFEATYEAVEEDEEVTP